MRKPDDYLLNLSDIPGTQLPPALAERIFHLVWRFDFTAPGFCLLDFRPGVDSHQLRSWMLTIEEQLSEVVHRHTQRRFSCRSAGRFDQQETTKFHLDGAPAESMLMLGYEPSRVRSRLLLADYSRCIFDLGIDPQRFLTELNPMYSKGEQALGGYVTELPQPGEGHSRILLVNNSSLPFTEARTNPLGVMHKAEIINPAQEERRLVNSMMIVMGEADEVGREQLRAFVTTDAISQKVY